MGSSPALILTLLIVLFQIHHSEGSCGSCTFPGTCSKLKCCQAIDRMLGRCLKDKSTDFKTVFTNNLPDSLWTLDSNLPNDKIMSGKTADSSSPLSSVDNGIQGKAVQLKGNVALRLSDYKDECLVNNSMALTVSLWLKYGNSTSENQTFFTLGKDTTTDGGDRLQISQPNKTLDEVGVLLNSDRGRLFLRFPCPWNIWSHIVVTWNSTESFVIYRNGKPIEMGNYDICFGCNTTHDGELHIGGINSNATVDEIAMWCKELNSTEVKQIYDYYKGPTGYYLVLNMHFADQNSKSTFSSKVQSFVPGASLSDPGCVTGLVCSFNIYVAGDDGDAVVPLINSLGQELKNYYKTVVPNSNVKLEGQSLVPSEISIRWQIDDDMKFSIFQYYNLSLVEVSSSLSDIVSVSHERYDLVYNFVNLTAYTEYNITLKQCFLGGACKSSTISVTTAEIAPGQPETIEAITMNTTCIKLQFKKPKEPVGGKIRTFVISYRPVDSPSQEPIVINITTTVKDSYDHDICGLSAGTVYTFNVSFTTIATGPSVNIEGKTQGPVPTGAPKVVSHNGTLPYDSSTTCKITWDMLSAAESQGNLTSFRITYNKLDSSEIMYCEIGICNTTKILTELDHYSIYSVTVSATNSQGIGPSSKPVLCYTESLAPAGPPQNLSAICKTSTSIVVKWAAVDKRLRNGAILGHNITYLKHGDPPSNSKHITVYGESTLQAEITQLEKYTEYNLSINAFTSKGAGNYSTYANISAFTCEDVPDGPPSDLKVLEQSNISCTISWSAINATMANGIIKGYEVTGNDTNNTDSNTNCVGTILTCGLNATFKELKPFRMHHFKASGFNSKGSSIYSEILECMTQEGAPLVAPPNLRCTPKTSRSMEVCWDDMPMLQKQGIIREYILEYLLLNNSASGQPTPEQTTSSNLCVEVNNLQEYSMYSVKAKAVTVLEGNFSETPIECMTMEGLPTFPPANVSGYNITAYSLLVHWSELPVNPPGILRCFVVFYRVWNASEDTTQNITVPASKREHTIENLELHTTYCIQVAACTVGVGPKSACVHVSTDDKQLPPPENKPEKVYQMANSTTKNCSIKWTKANNTDPDPDSHIIGYVIFYRFFGTNDTWKEEKAEGADTTRYVLENLEEYSKYEIRVAGYNIYGTGNKSVMLLCETKEDAPTAPPPDIVGINSSSTSISVSWNDIPKTDLNGKLRKICVLIWVKNNRADTEQTICIDYKEDNSKSVRKRRAISIDPETKVITGLDKYTTYAIQVYGVTVADGPKSDVIYVTTAEDAPTAPVRNLTVTNSSSSSLFMTWSNIAPENIHGILRYFVVYYWRADWPIIERKNITLPIDDVRHNSTGVLAGSFSGRRKRRSVTVPPTAEFKFNMTGLEIWTNYSVQVAGFTVATGVPSSEITVSTDEDRPCLPPDDIRFSVPWPKALKVHWKEVIRNCTNGIIRGYRLIYQEMIPSASPITVNLTTDKEDYIIDNMNMDANYTIQLLAYTTKGDGNVSFDLAPPDRNGPKHSPINVTAENFTTPTSIPVSWKPIEEPGLQEKLLGYQVSWRVLTEGLEEIEEAPWVKETVRKDALSYTIKTLKNFVHYQIEVAGFTRGGNGPSGITFADTCRCFRRIATNYRVFAPYNAVQISKNLKKVNMSGMIPGILNNLTISCCQSCKSHGSSYVDFVNNGHNKSAYQYNELDVIELIDDTNDLSFPIYGWKWQDTYQELYRYMPLVESPGFALLLLEPKTESPLQAIVKSILDTWPYLLIVCLMALVAGIIMWFLDTSYNEEHFPHSYLKGIANGWWWAFISMTTLGYGDKVPMSDRSKVFAVVWVLMGLVIYGILSGSICTAFTTVIYKSSTQLYGSQVAAIYDTPEYRFGVRRSAKVNTNANYTRFDEILQALLDGEVQGILMDAYEAGTKAKVFEEKAKGRIRVQKVFDYSSTFGVVLAGPSTRLYQCSREWMSANRAEMTSHIEKYMGVVEEDTINELVEIATGLFDANSPTFKDFLKYSLIAGGVLVALGLIWEFYYNVNKKKKNKLEATSEAFLRKERITKELGSFTRQFLEQLMDKISELKEKHEEEQLAFRRNNKHLLKKKPKGKLLQLELLFRSDHTVKM